MRPLATFEPLVLETVRAWLKRIAAS